MRTIDTASRLASAVEEARRAHRRVGLVPTMGALHAGHESLIARAKEQCDAVVLSIFVNPTQFGSRDDLTSYPRRLEADLALAEARGTDICFVPEEKEMYPLGEPEVTVQAGRLANELEGKARPSHFSGVATVVTKLFVLSAPHAAYFGEKDYQQLAIIRRLVADLSFPIEVVGCETVRAADGLALSSRNELLSDDQRAAASVLYEALRAGRDVIDSGESPQQSEQAMRVVIGKEPLAHLDYAVCRDASSLESPSSRASELRLLVAAHFGTTRLIDNLGATR